MLAETAFPSPIHAQIQAELGILFEPLQKLADAAVSVHTEVGLFQRTSLTLPELDFAVTADEVFKQM